MHSSAERTKHGKNNLGYLTSQANTRQKYIIQQWMLIIRLDQSIKFWEFC